MQKSGNAVQNDQTSTPRGRGRPRAFDRDTALEQAMLLFWRKGFEATSISDLTQAMGIGSPSLYAAFGSKEALYVEALGHYQATFDKRGFNKPGMPARDAVESYLMESAAVLTGAHGDHPLGCPGDHPLGCMVTLASVCSDEHRDLYALMRAERQAGFDRLKQRLSKAVTDGEIPASIDVHALARFVQTVLFGMSILARDGASRDELEAAVHIAMAGWDARVGRPEAA